MQRTFNFFLSEDEQYFLEVTVECLFDTSNWPAQIEININAVSLNGVMSIRPMDVPKDLRLKLEEFAIQKQIEQWEMQ